MFFLCCFFLSLTHKSDLPINRIYRQTRKKNLVLLIRFHCRLSRSRISNKTHKHLMKLVSHEKQWERRTDSSQLFSMMQMTMAAISEFILRQTRKLWCYLFVVWLFWLSCVTYIFSLWWILFRVTMFLFTKTSFQKSRCLQNNLGFL